MQETSASRNGLLINQRIVEVDGRNVMAFKVIDKIQLRYKKF